ncbi:MAG: hemerythrin domain-containing protein [Dehalococcoidia bacterium]
MTEPEGDRVVGPLREMRAKLHDGLRQIHVAAEGVDSAEPRVALAAAERASEYAKTVLGPYSHAEEFTLFPAVDGVLATRGACQVMVAQHASLAAMSKDLERVLEAAARSGDLAEFRRFLLPLLYGLYAAARAHLEAEDDAYLPLLDEHLSESQVVMIVDNMERIAAANQPQ